jgi:hypothetical protein
MRLVRKPDAQQPLLSAFFKRTGGESKASSQVRALEMTAPDVPCDPNKSSSMWLLLSLPSYLQPPCPAPAPTPPPLVDSGALGFKKASAMLGKRPRACLGSPQPPQVRGRIASRISSDDVMISTNILG